MSARALLQVGLGLIGVQIFFEAIGLIGAMSMAGQSWSSGILPWFVVELLALFAGSYALVIENRAVTNALALRANLNEAPAAGSDLRPIIIGLFGVWLLLRSLPGAASLLRSRVPVGAPLVAVLLLQLAVGGYFALRPVKILELWDVPHPDAPPN